MKTRLPYFKTLFFTLLLAATTASGGWAQAPTITGFTPTQGPVGSLISINGTNLTNTTSVSVFGVPAIKISNTATQLVILAMPGTTSGAINLTTPNGSVNSSAPFLLTAEPPPLTQQGARLRGSNAVGASRQGYGVGLSADGNTAVVVGPSDGNGWDGSGAPPWGAIWVYTRTNNIWSQQGSKLVPTNSYGLAYSSPGVSADGNTFIVGKVDTVSTGGGAYVFTRINGVWSQQAQLYGTGGTGGWQQGQGQYVSISADGNTALITNTNDGYSSTGNTSLGAAWIFKRNGTTWSQAGGKLVPNDATGDSHFGGGAALSADGKYAVIGGYSDDVYGAAWIFTENAGVWAQQGSKITRPSQDISQFGAGVAINANGSIVAINGGKQTQYVVDRAQLVIFNVSIYKRNGSTWSFQSTLSNINYLPFSWNNAVGLNAEGTRLVIGCPGYGGRYGPGAAVVYQQSNDVWDGGTLVTAFDSPNAAGYQQGTSVAISLDGKTVLVGAPLDDGNPTQPLNHVGAARAYAATTPGPVVTGYSNSPICQGSVLTITGENLFGATAVKFGSITATTFSILSATQISVTVPSNATSDVVTVVYPFGNAYGAMLTVLPTGRIDSFTPTSACVGASVTISGANLNGITAVSFGGVPAIGPFTSTGTQIVVTVPANAGTGSVSVTTQCGPITKSGFTFLQPTINNILPSPSACAGATLTVLGSNLANVTAVSFGGVAATGPFVGSGSQFTVVVPSGAVSGSLVVTAQCGVATYNSFTRLNPRINSFTPASACQGATVSINGADFTGASSVKFGGVDASFTVVSPILITAIVPVSASTGPISVSGVCGPFNSPTNFTFTPSSTISSFSTSTIASPKACVGSTVTVNGTNFKDALNNTLVSQMRINGTVATGLTVVSATQLTATVASGTTSGLIVLTTTCGPVPSGSSLEVVGTPSITSLSQTPGGCVGSQVTINGTNFTTENLNVYFNGIPAITRAFVNTTQVTATVPANAISGPITVANLCSTSAPSASNFTFTPPLGAVTITAGASSTEACTGNTVTLTGTNLSSATSVTYNGGTLTPTVLSPTQIRVTVSNTTAAAITSTFAVSNACGQVQSGNFIVRGTPTVTNFNPLSKCGSSPVTITINGTNLEIATAANVKIGTTSATSIYNVSGNQITADFPATTTTGVVQVTTSCGVSPNTAQFLVHPPLPAAPGGITGPGSINLCTTSYGNYTVAAVSGATSYTWTYWNDDGTFNSSDVTTTPTIRIYPFSEYYSFYLSVTANNGCGSSAASGTRIISVRPCGGRVSANFELDTPVGIYPNPANAVLNIVLEEAAGKVEATLTDLNGNLVKTVVQKDVKAVNINTSDVNAGIYVLTLVVDGKRTTQRIQVQH